jgi:hypothetical protein
MNHILAFTAVTNAVNLDPHSAIAWAPMTIAFVLGAIAAVDLWHEHLPRIAGFVGAIAAVMAITSVRPFMRGIGHRLGPGPLLIVILVMLALSAGLTWMDYQRHGYTEALIRRKTPEEKAAARGGRGSHGRARVRTRSQGRNTTPAGAPGTALATPGTNPAARAATTTAPASRPAEADERPWRGEPHLLRPFFEVTFLLLGLMFLYMDWSTVTLIFSHGWGQSWTMISTRGQGG